LSCSPASSSSTALPPKRVARTRSNAVGEPPALQVAEHDGARLLAGQFGQRVRHALPGAAEPLGLAEAGLLDDRDAAIAWAWPPLRPPRC
jgi:hypothetical protein